MKKTLSLSLYLFVNLLFSQTELRPILNSPQSPGVSSLLRVNPISVNESRGKPNISIPIIETSFINYPINVNLVYNPDGLKVNTESSWVGNSWSLTYGGLITREVKGSPDEENRIAKFNNRIINYWDYVKEEYDYCLALDIIESNSFIDGNDIAHDFNEYFYNNNGELSGYTGETIKHKEFSMPDIFNYILPNGVSGQFIFDNRNSGTSKILDSNSYLVNYVVNSSDNSLESFTIIDNEGYKYLFNEVEKSTLGNKNSKSIWGVPQNGFYTQPESYWVGGVAKKRPYCKEEDKYSDVGSYDLFFKEYNLAWHLKEIIPPHGDTITFQYQTSTHRVHTPVESMLGPVQSYSGNYAVPGASKINTCKEYKTKTISKIESKEGYIEFKLNDNVREDVEKYSYLKSLNEIIFKNKNGILIKKVVFNTSYKNSVGVDDIPDDRSELYKLYYKRLWLDGIQIYDKKNSRPLSYKFKYNSNPLPSRLSLEQDYWGFYNGNGSDNDDKILMIPNLWYYPDDNYSYSRVSNFSIFKRSNYVGQEYRLSNKDFPSNYFSSTGENLYADRESNLFYSKSGILEEIEYPTGGKMVVEYELNDFLVEDQVIKGNGVRVSKTYLTDNNQKINETLYEYKNTDGKTSGKVLSIPVFGAEEFWTTNNITSTIRYLYSSIQNRNEDLGVYYETVTKKILGKGKVISKYDVPINIESENGFWDEKHQQYFYQKNYDITDSGNHILKRWYSKSRPITYNLNYLIGDLKERKYFDENNNLKKEEIYTYEFSNRSKKYYFTEKYTDYAINRKLNTVLIAKKELKKLITKEFLKSTNISEEMDYLYNNYSLIKEIKTKTSDNNIERKVYYYPTDKKDLKGLDIETSFAVDKLLYNNRLSEILQQEIFVNEKLLTTEQRLFNFYEIGHPDQNLGITKLNKIRNSKGAHNIENRIVYHFYDNKGNPTEISKKDGMHVVYIWGYEQTQLIAKVENATLSDISSAIITNLQRLSNLDDDSCTDTESCDEKNLRAELNNLRMSLPNAKVTTFTYNPLIGVTSITDLRGETTYYEYDDFSRLKLIKDADGNLLKEHKYNYKN